MEIMINLFINVEHLIKYYYYKRSVSFKGRNASFLFKTFALVIGMKINLLFIKCKSYEIVHECF